MPNYFPDYALLVHRELFARYMGGACRAPCSSHPAVPEKSGLFGRDASFGPVPACSQAVNLEDKIAHNCCKWIVPRMQATHEVHMAAVSAMVLLCWLHPARVMRYMLQQADLQSIRNSLQ